MLPLLLGGAALLFLVTRKSSAAPATPAAGPIGDGTTTPPHLDCAGVPKLPPPIPGMGTGFAALPTDKFKDLGDKTYREVIEYFMKLTPDSADLPPAGSMMRAATIESTALATEQWGKQLRCSGYVEAANLMYQQAKEMRQWK